MIHKNVKYILAALIVLVFSSVALAGVPVEVFVGKGTIVTLKEPSKRISISSPEIADVNLVSPTEIVINGKKFGSTNLIVWDKKGKTTFFDITVVGDIDLNKLEAQIKDIAPNDNITVEFAKDTIVLSGKASNQQTIDKVVQIAQAYSLGSTAVTSTNRDAAGLVTTKTETTGKVLNHIIIENAQQVMLEVKVAQIDKTKLKEMGISYMIKDKKFELTAPGIFAQPEGTIGNAIQRTRELGDVVGPEIGPGIERFNLEDVSPQIGFAHFPSDIAVILKALSSKGYAKVLAEPNLIVRSGERGNFHVGTRFPIQTVTGVGADATISIVYEEVGIRINFAPEVLDTGAVRLKIDPAEVSNITDFVRLQNLIAPVVDTRTVKTSVDLKEGESLILAGLLSDETKKNIQKIPLLGDIPIFGALFRSTSEELKEKELVFFITPKMVKPTPPGQKTELPTDKKLTPDQEREFNWIPLPKESVTEENTAKENALKESPY